MENTNLIWRVGIPPLKDVDVGDVENIAWWKESDPVLVLTNDRLIMPAIYTLSQSTEMNGGGIDGTWSVWINEERTCTEIYTFENSEIVGWAPLPAKEGET